MKPINTKEKKTPAMEAIMKFEQNSTIKQKKQQR